MASRSPPGDAFAATPDREHARLSALREYASPDAEQVEALRAVARTVARACGAPMGLVTLVGAEHVEALAAVGLPEGFAVARELSFCSHTILSTSPFLVADAAGDPRFGALASGPPHFRFYAGAPLIGRDGQAIGALCVIDVAPRPASPEVAQLVADGARVAMRLLEAGRESRRLLALEGELEAEREFQRFVLERVPGTIILAFDRDLRVRNVFGARALAAAGMTPADYIGKSVAEWALPGNRAAIVEAMGRCISGESCSFEIARAGRRFLVSLVPVAGLDGAAPRGLAFSSDVTERDALRDELARQERLKTTGTLAAGVGHEINNPLTSVLANLEAALEDLGQPQPPTPSAIAEVREMLRHAQDGAMRIQDIVRGLASFVRSRDQPAPVDVAKVIDASIRLTSHEVSGRATVTTELAPVAPVLAEETRLMQVFVNLLVNAAHAFPTADPGRNHIVLRSRSADPGKVVLEVSDDGPGMTEDARARIFDPFFTTKPVGEGLGLGLWICQNIMSSFGGSLECESEAGRGATFRMTLPAARRFGGGHRPRVLLVDDELPITRALTRMLAPDFDVIASNDPREALARMEGGEAFDAVVCDLSMPHLSGVELHRRVSPAQGARFVFITGASVGDLLELLRAIPNELVEKPFTARTMREVVRRVALRTVAAPDAAPGA